MDKKNRVDINLNIDFLDVKSNPKKIFGIISNQYRYFTKHQNLIDYARKNLKQWKVILTLLIASLLFLLIIPELYLQLTLFIVIVFFIITCTIRIKNINQEIEKNNDKNNKFYVSLRIYEDSLWKELFNNVSSRFKVNNKFNITSNNHYLYITDKNILIFYDFAIRFYDSKVECYTGKRLLKNLTYHTAVKESHHALSFKYKKLDYQKWTYQRKDGGPDRRYNNNQLHSFYKVQWIELFGLKIEVPNKDYYEKIVKRLEFEMTTFDCDFAEYNEVYKSFDLDNKIGIKRYLDKNSILYSDFGESIEFKKDNISYVIDETGFEKSLNKTFEELIGEIF